MSISTIIAQSCEFIHNFFTVPKPQRRSRPAAVKRNRLRLPLTMANAPAWATDRRAGAARGIAVEEDNAYYISPHRFLSCREFGPLFPRLTGRERAVLTASAKKRPVRGARPWPDGWGRKCQTGPIFSFWGRFIRRGPALYRLALFRARGYNKV